LHFTSILQFSFSRTVKTTTNRKICQEKIEKIAKILLIFCKKINNAIPQGRYYLIQQLNNSSLVNQGQNILHLDLLP